MEYSKEETEDWFRGGELPDKNTKLGIKEYIFDDVTLTLDKNLHPTIKIWISLFEGRKCSIVEAILSTRKRSCQSNKGNHWEIIVWISKVDIKIKNAVVYDLN